MQGSVYEIRTLADAQTLEVAHLIPSLVRAVGTGLSHWESSGSHRSRDLSRDVRAANSPDAVGSRGQAENTMRSSKACTSPKRRFLIIVKYDGDQCCFSLC